MQALNFPVTTVAYQLLFLVPGYLTYVLAIRVGKVIDTRDRFDKLVLSLLASATSIAILYAGFVGVSFILQGRFNTPSPFALSWLQLSVGFILHVLLTVIGGVLLGHAMNHYRNEEVEWAHPWITLHSNIASTPTVDVKLKDGTKLNGQLVGYERTPDSQDLRLSNVGPQNRTVYVFGSDISHVCFLSGLSKND